MKYIVKDNRETVELSAPGETKAGGAVAVQGKFHPKHRILELTDAQVVLFAEGLEAALKDGMLLIPREE